MDHAYRLLVVELLIVTGHSTTLPHHGRTIMAARYTISTVKFSTATSRQ